MKISVDYSMVKDFLEMAEDGGFTDHRFKQFIEKVESGEVFQKMLGFYNGLFDKEQYFSILYKSINSVELNKEEQDLQSLYNNLRRLRNTNKLKSKFDLIREYDFNALKEELYQTLPSNTEIDANIYFTLDGMNAGSIYGNNDMLLNAMFWPSRAEDIELIEGVILHEFHHIGVKYWVNRNSRFKLKEFTSGADIAGYLSVALLGEGAATYLFNQSNLYPLIIESHGSDFAEQYSKSMDNKKRPILASLDIRTR